MKLNSQSQVDEFSEGPSRNTWILAGALVGAAAAYYLDPARGNYRRHVLRDRVFHWSRQAEWMALKGVRDWQNRLQGVWYRWQHPLSDHVDDRTLESRVRTEFGRKVRHARSILTEVHEGVVTLSGPVLSDEVQALIRCVRALPGVKKVINHLDVRTGSDNVPGLQGPGKSYFQ